jgi:hypothetical protein
LIPAECSKRLIFSQKETFEMGNHALSKMVVVAFAVLLLAATPANAASASGEAYEVEAVLQIEGANPWGAVLISGGRELLVAERQAGRVSFSIREPATGNQLRRLRARDIGWIPYWGLSADGARLVLGVFESGTSSLVVIDVATDQEVRRFPIPENRGLGGVAISADGRRVAAIGANFLVRVHVWDVESGEGVQEIKVAAASGIALSPDGTRVLTTVSLMTGLFGGGVDAIAELWDVVSGRRLTEVKVKDAGFNGAIFSPDGTRFLTANAGGRNSPAASSATLWDADTGRELMAIGRDEGPGMGLSFSADGARIATVSSDRRVRIWDAATGGLVGALPAHGLVGEAIRLEVTPGTFVALSETQVAVVSPEFAREGTALVTSGLDGTVKVWVDAEERRIAFQASLSAAQSGDLEAMYRVASGYREGRGVGRNGVVAAQWMTQAADGGHGPANFELAGVLVSGDAGRQDCVAGGERLRKAIASGSVEAGARLDAVLSPLGGRQGAEALTPQIQADLLEAQIIEVLTRKEYPAFLANLCALEALGHAERLPVETRRELLYHRAVGLRAAGKPSAALAALNQYLNEAGNAGASYTQAIQMLRPLQEEARR